jgi:superfamily II DNA helicase RecQ
MEALGLSSYRMGQEEAIEASVRGEHVHFFAPTGHGKSAVAWVPAIAAGGVTVIVTPLVALARDQVAKLSELGISAVSFGGGGCDHGELLELVSDTSPAVIVYACAETFEHGMPRWAQSLASRGYLKRIVIDEVHVAHDYGAGFRPSYQTLPSILRQAVAPLTLMSATVSCSLEDELAEAYGTQDAARVRICGEGRASICVRFPPDEFVRSVAAEAAAFAGQGIVFVNSRRRAESVARDLEAHGINIEPYHAGQGSDQRESIESSWRCGAVQWVCATSAFGLGIDNANCCAVVFMDPPLSAEAMMQGMGRCGRGECAGTCVLYNGGFGRARWQLQAGMAATPQLAERVRRFESVVRVLADDGGCRHARLRAALGDKTAPGACANGCDACFAAASL